jgi:hypothetical protein
VVDVERSERYHHNLIEEGVVPKQVPKREFQAGKTTKIA